MNSATVFTGSDGVTISMFVVFTMFVIGANAVLLSYGICE